jgi:hypothetical protein
MMNGITFRAVASAFSAAFFGGFVLVGLVGFIIGALGRYPAETTEAFMARLSISIPYNAAILLVGTATDVLMGFIAARVAPRAPRPNAIAAGLLILLVSVPMIPWLSKQEPMFFLVASFVVVLPAALLGVWISERIDRPRLA